MDGDAERFMERPRQPGAAAAEDVLHRFMRRIDSPSRRIGRIVAEDAKRNHEPGNEQAVSGKVQARAAVCHEDNSRYCWEQTSLFYIMRRRGVVVFAQNGS